MAQLYLILWLASSICILNAKEIPEHHRVSKRDVQNEIPPGDPPMKIEPIKKGILNTKHYRIFFKNEQGLISPFHDIPLHASIENETFNMVVEVPRWTNEKMEISLNEPLNPIMHRMKNHSLEYIPDVHPHDGYVFNYGALPETYENPTIIDRHTGLKGDGHPLNVMEIGDRIAKRGEIMQVKVLGALGVIDNGHIDYKIVAVATNDSNADRLNDIGDCETVFPGFLKGVIIWFKEFIFDNGKPKSELAFNGEYKNKEFAMKLIKNSLKQWMDMMLIEKKEEYPDPHMALMNTLCRGHQDKVSFEHAAAVLDNITFPTGTPPPTRKPHWKDLRK